jgi:hypothetical protein
MLNGTCKGLTLAALAALTMALVPAEGRCQDNCSVLQVLVETVRPPKPPKKPQIIMIAPHCPMGVCTGAACPNYCPATCVRPVAVAPTCESIIAIGCRAAADAAAASSRAHCNNGCQWCPLCATICSGCKDGKSCGTDCAHGCNGDCATCPGCAVDGGTVVIRGGMCCQSVPACCQAARAVEDHRTETLQRLCVEQAQTIRQLVATVNEMQHELTAMRHEMAAIRNGFGGNPILMPAMPPHAAPMPINNMMPMPVNNWNVPVQAVPMRSMPAVPRGEMVPMPKPMPVADPQPN